MTTPLSKMVALLIPSPLTPKRGRGSAGRLSEAKKAKKRARSSVGYSGRGRLGYCGLQVSGHGNGSLDRQSMNETISQ